MADRRPMSEGEPLRLLARALGVQMSYTGLDGARHAAGRSSVLAAVRAMGVGLEDEGDAPAALERLKRERSERACPPVLVSWIDQDRSVRLDLEGGAGGPVRVALERAGGGGEEVLEADPSRPETFALPGDLAIGEHTVIVDRPDDQGRPRREHATLLAAPSRCYDAPVRAGGERATDVGVWMPLYAAHGDRDWGVGNYTDLAALGAWSGGAGCSLFGTLPLLATYLDEPFDPSPYAPVSRLFWNELFVDPAATPEARTERGRAVVSDRALRARAAALNGGRLVDYREAWRLVRSALEPLAEVAFADPSRRAEMERALRDVALLGDYVSFRAEVDRRRAPWRAWPEGVGLAPGQAPDLNDPGTRFWVYAQVEARRQLGAAWNAARAAGSGLYLDLPVGVNGDGFDAWAFREQFAEGVSTGAPPDAFTPEGQDWGFPPLAPEASQRAGHAQFRRVIARNLECCDALRIDHVMMLHRLFWIPRGAPASEGLYVTYPARELYAILAIESHRHRARIVGENLGVVPDEVNKALKRRRILGMSVGQFEFEPDREDPLPAPARDTLACLNTHDMPTFRSFWTGSDVERRLAYGLLDENGAQDERSARARLREAVRRRLGYWANVDPEGDAPDVLRALLRYLVERRPAIALATLEDLWGEDEPQNIPGITPFPNWRRRASKSVDEIVSDEAIAALLRSLSPTAAPAGVESREGASS